MKKLGIIVLVMVLALAAAGCGSNNKSAGESAQGSQASSQASSETKTEAKAEDKEVIKFVPFAMDEKAFAAAFQKKCLEYTGRDINLAQLEWTKNDKNDPESYYKHIAKDKYYKAIELPGDETPVHFERDKNDNTIRSFTTGDCYTDGDKTSELKINMFKAVLAALHPAWSRADVDKMYKKVLDEANREFLPEDERTTNPQGTLTQSKNKLKNRTIVRVGEDTIKKDIAFVKDGEYMLTCTVTHKPVDGVDEPVLWFAVNRYTVSNEK